MYEFKENEIITLTAEDGSDVELEYMGQTQYQGATYGAFYPVPEEDEDILDADYDMVILKMYDLNGAQAFDMVEDEELFDTLGEIFMDMIFGED